MKHSLLCVGLSNNPVAVDDEMMKSMLNLNLNLSLQILKMLFPYDCMVSRWFANQPLACVPKVAGFL